MTDDQDDRVGIGIESTEDVEITRADGVLHIRADVRGREEGGEGGRDTPQSSGGMFERALRLVPALVRGRLDRQGHVKDGILEVVTRVPLGAGRRLPRKIGAERDSAETDQRECLLCRPSVVTTFGDAEPDGSHTTRRRVRSPLDGVEWVDLHLRSTP